MGGDEAELDSSLVQKHLLALQSHPDNEEKTVFACLGNVRPKIIGSLEDECCLVGCRDGYYYVLYEGGLLTLGLRDETQPEGPCYINFEENMIEDILDLLAYLLNGVDDIVDPKFELASEILNNLEIGGLKASHLNDLQILYARMERLRQDGGAVAPEVRYYLNVSNKLKEYIDVCSQSQSPSMLADGGAAGGKVSSEKDRRHDLK